MARQRFYVSDGDPANGDTQSVAFARRLNQALLAKGWRQADLVRAVHNLMPSDMDSDARAKAFGRHLVSSYMRGRHMPSPVNIALMAKALGLTVRDFVPEGAAVVVGHTDRAIQVTMSTGGMARLKLDMELPNDIALQIMALANGAREDD